MTTLGDTIYIDGENYEPALVKDLPKGEFFVRKAGAKRVYKRGDYDRSSKRFSCIDELDFCREMLLRGDTVVYVGFTY